MENENVTTEIEDVQVSELSDENDATIKSAQIESSSSVKKKKKKDSKKSKLDDIVPANDFRSFVRVFLITFTVVLVMYFLYSIYGMSSYRKALSEQNAIVRSAKEENMVATDFDAQLAKLYAMTDHLNGAKTSEDVIDYLSTFIGSDDFGNINYYYNGTAYTAEGNEIHSVMDPAIKEAISNTKEAITVRFTETIQGIDCIGFYIPIKGSPVIDGILSMMQDSVIVKTDLTTINEKSASVFYVPDGSVISYNYGKETEFTFGSNFYTFLRNFSSDKTFADDFRRELTNKGEAAMTINIASGDFIVYASLIEKANNNYVIGGITPVETFLTDTYSYSYQIMVVSAICIFTMIVSQIYFFFFYRQKTNELTKLSLVNKEFNVPNMEKFREEAENRIKSNPTRAFAVMYLRIDQYDFYSTQVDSQEWYEVMQFLFKIVSNGFYGTSTSVHKEIFGYDGDGSFAVLYSYRGRDEELKTYVRLLNGVLNRNGVLQRASIVLTVRAGAYIIQPQRNISFAMAVNSARKALEMETAQKNRDVYLNVYTTETETTLLNEARIEMRMEAALAQGEFEAFLQPKYSFAEDCIDSAEALVRWIDPNTGNYTFPAKFIYLFESNGFITKLDHFIYVEICKYFKEAAEQGQKVVPISVNVSRVTASQPDFLKFYCETKKQYGVRDGLLTIEFTESFSMENYELLAKICDELHKNGIACSIDDFGSGYSSFNMLKNAAIDELKMDVMFLKKGADSKKDNIILSHVMKLGKSLGIKVVQEGVETIEQFNYLKELGFDVMQGYYYAKPIPMREYKIFINTNTSIRYKAKVK